MNEPLVRTHHLSCDTRQGIQNLSIQRPDTPCLNSSPVFEPARLPCGQEQTCSSIQSRHVLAACCLALLFFCVSLLFCGHWGVLESSEARYAEISREMLQSQDWLHPRLLGIYHLHKPPVVYWITALGLKLFGVNPFGVRFFQQVSFVMQALAIFRIGCLLFKNSQPALLAMAVYLTTPAAFIASRNLTTDSFLLTLELFAVMTWISYRAHGRIVALYGFYGSLGLAMLTKGPVGLLLPLVICFTYRPPSESFELMRIRAHLLPFLLFLLLGFSWYGVLIWNDPRLLDYFVMKHTVERMMNPEAFNRSEPWWFFVVLAPLLSLPWSFVACWQNKGFQKIAPNILRLLLVWVFVPLVVFSLSASKLMFYILPLFPGLALLIGSLLQVLADDRLRRVAIFTCLLYVTLSLAILLAPSFSTVIDLSGSTMILPPLMMIGMELVWRFAPGVRQKIVSCGICFFLILFPLSGNLLGQNPLLIRDVQPLADIVQKTNPQHHPVIVYNSLLPSLAFHLNQDIITVTDTVGSLQRETQFETNSNWKSLWFNLRTAEDQIRLTHLLESGAIVIAKHGMQLDDKIWGNKLVPLRKSGRWQIYRTRSSQ